MTAVIAFLGALSLIELVLLIILVCITIYYLSKALEALIVFLFNDFFPTIWDNLHRLWDDTTIWWNDTAQPYIIDTATDIAEEISVEIAEKYSKVKSKIEEWAKEIEKTSDLSKKFTHRVYQILMEKRGIYDKRTWGFGWNKKHNYPTDCGGNKTFKYGITSADSLRQRYTSGYIHEQLYVYKRLRGIFLTPKIHILQAKATESRLLLAYYMAYGTFPPGNSKFG